MMHPLNLPLKSFFLFSTAIFGFITVLLGAFGAHMLKDVLNSEMKAIFETGIRYQMFHTLALGLLAVLDDTLFKKLAVPAGWFFIFGIILFSGSLYTLALTSVRIWGAVTPVGGLLFLFGWGGLALSCLKNGETS